MAHLIVLLFDWGTKCNSGPANWKSVKIPAAVDEKGYASGRIQPAPARVVKRWRWRPGMRSPAAFDAVAYISPQCGVDITCAGFIASLPIWQDADVFCCTRRLFFDIALRSKQRFHKLREGASAGAAGKKLDDRRLWPI